MRAFVTGLVLLATVAHGGPALRFEKALDDGPSYSAYLVSYHSSGLKVHAMIAVPKTEKPAGGFPVVIANHGYVPDPTMYGITAEGKNSRPGDYYRPVPDLYASRGFIVVLPDYRGHNDSEGYEQIRTQNRESIDLYADDVITLMSHLGEVAQADLERVFMWSHSMGGGVSMRALLATDIVKASSFWATMEVAGLRDQFSKLDGPVMIQHATGDQSTPISNSVEFAAALRSLAHPVTLHSYDSDSHFFAQPLRDRAAERDAEFFRRAVTP